jgi:putative ABC transport system permease protein
MIKVNQLNKYFNRRQKNEIHVLNNVSLEFPDKGLVVLLGQSGSGKTTLLNVIGGLDKVQSGTIDFGDVKIEGYHAQTWDKIRNEYVGYIFQNYNLLPELSVFDNVGFVLKLMGIRDPKEIEKRVNYILNSIGMYPFRKKKGMQLSGGQMQRVAIARALVKNPKVIIADEPTGNLDSKNTLDVMNIIKEISKQKLVILVTHEKEIAKFYGDRIIEIKDGQIIEDYLNEGSVEHHLDQDDTIYLKDLNQLSQFDDHHIKTSLYTDQKNEEPIEIKLIVKNKTLYIDIDTPIQKIKVLDKTRKNNLIKDEHFQKKSREEMTKTAFDLSVLDHQEVKRENRFIVSLKQTLIMALDKIIGTGIKGKLMLIAFFVSGIMIALSVSSLSAVAIVDPEPQMKLPRGYIELSQFSSLPMTYQQVLDLNPDDPNYFIHPYDGVSFQFDLPTPDSPLGGFTTQFDIISHINPNQMILGRAPATRYELVISKGIADIITKSASGQELGIWSYEHLLNERIRHEGVIFRIVGIYNSNVKVTYAREETIQFVSRMKLFDTFDVIPKGFIDPSFYTHGSLPEDGQFGMSRDLYITWFNTFPSGSFPQTITLGLTTYEISGVYVMQNYPAAMTSTVDTIRELKVQNSYRFSVFVSDEKAFLDSIKDINNLESKDYYQTTIDAMREEGRLALITTLVSSLVLIGLAMIGFYFVIRSSLFSRIYQISVYRALGVNKADIFRSFIIEVLVITSITTALGYALGSYAISVLQKGLLGELRIFYVNGLTFMIGLIIAYLINMLAGLFPVFNLLKKTPAQILSQYDI